MVNFKPYEQNQLEALLSSGLAKADPTAAFQIFSGLQGGAIQRQAERQAMNQQMMQDAIGGLQSYAATPGVDPSGLDALVGSYQAMNPALAKPKFDSRLDQAAGSLEGLIGGGTGGNISMEDAQSVAAEAAGAVEKGIPLHEARSAYMNLLRATGIDGATHDKLFDLFGQAYASNVSTMNEDQQAKLLNAPITGADVSTPDVSSAPPAGTGDPSILEQLMGGRGGLMMSSLTGGMTAIPQMIAGLPNVTDDMGHLSSGIMGGVARALGAGGGGAPAPPPPAPRGPTPQGLEELLRQLTGSLGSGMMG